MDKDFFSSVEDRRDAFAERAGLSADQVRAELLLGSGRTYVLDRVVEAADGWVHLDVREVDEPETVVSVVLPYYHVTHVYFVKSKSRIPRAGFGG